LLFSSTDNHHFSEILFTGGETVNAAQKFEKNTLYKLFIMNDIELENVSYLIECRFYSHLTHLLPRDARSASAVLLSYVAQGCSGAGTRRNAAPANSLEPERRSGKCCWSQAER